MRVRNILGVGLGVSLFVAATALLFWELREHRPADILRAVGSVRSSALALAAVLTVLNYLVLTAYDALALRYIRHPLPYHKLAMASFIGYVFSHNATILGGSAARYRVYSSLGVSGQNVARLVVFCGITYWLGLLSLAGLIFVWEPDAGIQIGRTSLVRMWPVGVLFLAVVVAYVAVVLIRRRPLRVWGWEFPVPPTLVSAAQIGISALDWLLAASVLWALLPKGLSIGFSHYLAIFMMAQTLGFVSHVPGGLGVFESLMVMLLKDSIGSPQLMGCVLVYRLVYYLVPLGIAMILLTGHEVADCTRSARRTEASGK